MDPTQDGLVHALLFDGRGGAEQLDWKGVREWTPARGFLWMHLDYTGEQVQRWLEEESGLDPVSVEALVATETRPRSVVRGDEMLVILRGVNLNPGADPEDMVSLRMWIDGRRAITLRRRRVLAIKDVKDDLEVGGGPKGAGSFMSEICDRLTLRAGDTLSDLDDEVDGLEDEVVSASSVELRSKIADLRRQVIGLRRYLAPQRDALSRLYTERLSWLDEQDRLRIREVADRVMRFVEDLDSARERAAVAHEELAARVNEQMNRTMYILSLVAAIFLPLGLLTGLLGINVGGIPGANYPLAFLIVCAILAALAGGIWTLFRWKRLI